MIQFTCVSWLAVGIVYLIYMPDLSSFNSPRIFFCWILYSNENRFYLGQVAPARIKVCVYLNSPTPTPIHTTLQIPKTCINILVPIKYVIMWSIWSIIRIKYYALFLCYKSPPFYINHTTPFYILAYLHKAQICIPKAFFVIFISPFCLIHLSEI